MFEGKVALVTGGARGIGFAIGSTLAQRGARVILADLDGDAVREAASKIGAQHTALDVTDPQAWTETMDRISGDGLDLAVLNAGVATGASTLEAMSVQQYRRIMSINVDGVILGARSVLPLLRAQESSWLLATASLAGLTPMPMDPVYAATKHAVIGFVRSLAPQVAEDGVKVQALCPGIADTAIVTPDERHRLADAGLPLITLDQVAETAMAALMSEGTGEAWIAQLGREPLSYGFRGVPGAHRGDGSAAAPPTGWSPRGGTTDD